MRRTGYYVYALVPVTAIVAGALVWGWATWGGSRVAAAAALGVAGFHSGAVGLALVTDWHRAATRLRAAQRLQNRGKGRLSLWVCRDTRAWWRGGGIILTAGGVAFQALAVAVAFL